MRVIDFYNAHVRRIRTILIGVSLLALLLYGAFMLGAVAHAAGRTSTEKQLQSLNAEVSELESVFLAETKGLSLERAVSMGFVPPVAVATVYANTPGLTLR